VTECHLSSSLQLQKIYYATKILHSLKTITASLTKNYDLMKIFTNYHFSRPFDSLKTSNRTIPDSVIHSKYRRSWPRFPAASKKSTTI